jgi:hypothetical protein
VTAWVVASGPCAWADASASRAARRVEPGVSSLRVALVEPGHHRSVPHRHVMRVGDDWRLLSLRNVAGHGHVNGARFVVSIQHETEVTGVGPFGGDVIE